MPWLDKELDDTMPAKRHVGPMSKSWHDRLGLRPNNSMEPPPLRFAKHPEGRGSSTDPVSPVSRRGFRFVPQQLEMSVPDH